MSALLVAAVVLLCVLGLAVIGLSVAVLFLLNEAVANHEAHCSVDHRRARREPTT